MAIPLTNSTSDLFAQIDLENPQPIEIIPAVTGSCDLQLRFLGALFYFPRYEGGEGRR